MSHHPHPHNNSDDEDFGLNDFISFPVLPDPENDGNKTLTQIFANTLRKVTNNASTLVQTYLSPKSRNVSNGHPDHVEKYPGTDLTARLEEAANSDALTTTKLASLLLSDRIASGSGIGGAIANAASQESHGGNSYSNANTNVNANANINAHIMSNSNSNLESVELATSALVAPVQPSIGPQNMSESPPLQRQNVPPARVASPLLGGSGDLSHEQPQEQLFENSEIARQILPIAPSTATVSVSTPAFTPPPSSMAPVVSGATTMAPSTSASTPGVASIQTPPPAVTQIPQPHPPVVTQSIMVNPSMTASSATLLPLEPVSTTNSLKSALLHPRVTSDNKGLRIGTSAFSRIPVATAASTTSIHVLSSKDGPVKQPARSPFQKQAKQSKILKTKKTLQNRISSLFTNLPNDIELSDDSASETESIINESLDTDYITPITSASYNDSKLQPTMTNSYSLYSTTTIEPSRVKAERLLDDSIDSLSPSLSSFYALREKDLSRQKKTSGGNLSAAIIDNAKSIIANSNIVSSASSVINNTAKGKKKKQMPKKVSQNPLKTGGIPRKYWMNDAFVSDCLNCFKPFSAFRRKHHCRFCGQIFCSECTLFISYNQHKAQRKDNGNTSAAKKFSDKLRVCKPCYDDVIIYLSDDSSSSSEEEDTEEVSKDEEPTTPIEEPSSINGQNNIHVRAQSVNSRNEVLLQANKNFLNRDASDSKSILTSPSVRDRKYASPNPDMGTPTTLRQANTNIERPKPLPLMAIPTTRTGQAVEIPVSQSHLLSFSTSQYNKSTAFMTSLESTPIRDSLPNKGWFKNYSRPRNASTPDLSATSNFEGLSHMYQNFRAKAPSGSKYRVYSGSERDLISKRSASLEGEESDSSSSKDDADDDDDDRVSESENEDEQAMSLYTSLNHIAPNANDPLSGAIATTTVVPTLGEFPTMIVNEKLFGRRFGKVLTPNFGHTDNENTPLKSHNVSFLEDRQPRTGESLRSHERAHKSLLRMRSRRKSKTLRNTLVLSPNIYKAPVDTLPDHNLNRNRMSLILTTSSPVSSTPASPRSNSNNNLPDVNLSKVISEDAYSTPDSPTIHNPYHEPYDRTSSSLQVVGNESALESPRNALATRNSNNLTRMKLNSSEVSFSDGDAIDGQDELLNISFEGITMNSIREGFKAKSVRYQEYLDVILEQCFDDCDIKDDVGRWRKRLDGVLGAIENLKLTDTLDLKQYVKVKKILGGSIEQTSVIDGLFMTKDIDSRGMSSKISDPKIALLMFPIEYLKQKEQFISLRIIKAQQQVYITNLVSRLISLEPDIIIVGDLVCGLALKLLEEANITVISNTKPQVIERISRYTKADIFQTVNDLFFKKGSLGTCKQFEIKKYNYDGIVKTFSFFTGNDMTTGFTIALRGGDSDLLASIKYAVETVMMGELNSKLERKWLDDQQMMIVSDDQDEKVVYVTHQINEINEEMELEAEVGLPVCDISPDNNEIKHYVELFNKRKVSVSPVVKFCLPPVLIHTYNSFVAYYEYFKTNREIQKLTDASQIEIHWLEQLKLAFIDKSAENLPNKGIELLDILKFTSQRHLNELKTAYNIRSRHWTNCMNSTSYQLYPVFHKNIYVLHSTISLKYSTPCDGPNVVVVDYYSDNDKCFGLFLDQIFNDAKNVCDECGELLLNHCRSYCHGNGKLDFLIEMRSSDSSASSSSGLPGATSGIPNNRRVMWSVCSECNYSTPLTYMSNETYYLSIGKFFELNFWGHNVISSDHHSGCSHDFFKKYVKCFAMNDMIIKMQYSHLDTYEIVVPKKQVALRSEIDIRLRLESYTTIRHKADAFFNSIVSRLESIKVNEGIEDLEKALARANTLIAQANAQANDVYEQLSEAYNATSHTNYMSLNVVLRKLQEFGVEWNNIFNDFEKQFVPTENDLAKFTQFHIKNFLMDKYNSIDDEAIAKKVDAEKDKPSELGAKDELLSGFENAKKSPDVFADTSFDVSNASVSSIVHATPTTPGSQSTASINPVFVPTPRTKSLLKAMGDRINHMEQLLKESDSSPLPILTPNRRDTDGSSLITQNKVYELASYFDQMNFDQISQELKKLEKLNFKPIPVGESRPIVEIYHKIEDAVNVGKGEGQVLGEDQTKNKAANLRLKIASANSNSSPFNVPETTKTRLPRRTVSSIMHHPQPISPIPEGGSSKSISPNIMTGKTEAPGALSVLPAIDVTTTEADSANSGSNGALVTVPQVSATVPNKDTATQPQEKQSILKLLTKFWVERASTMWGDQQLEFALDSTEHTFADSEVIVREDEPSSLIALCLSSSDYRLKMKQMQSKVEHETSPEAATSVEGGGSNGTPNPGAQVSGTTATGTTGKNSPSVVISGTNTTLAPGGVNNTQTTVKNSSVYDKKSVNFAKIEKKFKRRNQLNGEGDELERVLTSPQLNHLKYQFVDGLTHFSCKIFYSEHFEALRWACGNHETFIQSLSRCVKWKSNGGKSGSNFLKTLDDRYIMKELSKSELELFVMIAPYYFKYISQSTYNTLTTAIAKIFGFYQVEIRNNDTNKVLFKMDFLIMENLFYDHKLTRIFDLKGSMRNRHVKQTGRENEVLLDENMIEYIYESPVCVKELLKRLMRGALFNDTSFLSAMDVMDYSLVVGIDDTSNKLYIGIIDWLRTFTWDKKVENWVKGNNLMGSKKRGKDPTIVTPKQYRNRFREAMERYILEIPDPWYLST